MKIIHEDRLVRRVYIDDYVTQEHSVSYHGKRRGADCLLSPAEARVYVERGTVAAVRFIMDLRGYRLKEAWSLLKRARGPVSKWRM